MLFRSVLAEIDHLVKAISTGEDLRWMRDDLQRLIEAPVSAAGRPSAAELTALLRSERDAWDERDLPAVGEQ